MSQTGKVVLHAHGFRNLLRLVQISVHNHSPYALGLQAHSRSNEAIRGHGAYGGLDAKCPAMHI